MNGSTLFIRETGFTVLNHSYYNRLSEVLYPVLKRNKKGLITVSTVREAQRLANFLNGDFQKARFSVYYDGLSEGEKRNILQDLNQSPHPHYLITVGVSNWMVRLPELTAYIDLDVNIPAQEQMSRFFSQKHYIPWIVDVLLLINYQNQTMREGLLSISEKKKSNRLENQPLSAGE